MIEYGCFTENEFIEKIQERSTGYCKHCHLTFDLAYSDIYVMIDGFQITAEKLPILKCHKCEKYELPEKTKFALIYGRDQCIKEKKIGTTLKRMPVNKKYNFTSVDFEYSIDDYENIPGLVRPRDTGFLTPVFFNREVLLKYDHSPKYVLEFFSTSYGVIYFEDEYIAFGVNRHGNLVMWLGDLAKLSKKEQTYLLSENIPSDHSIGSEFYEAQINVVPSKPSKKNELYAKRSKFVKLCFEKFGEKIVHLDDETLKLTNEYNGPIYDTEKELKQFADTFNQIYIEGINSKKLKQTLESLDVKTTNNSSIKLFEKWLETRFPSVNFYSLMSPLYILYDLRVACLHISSNSSKNEKLASIKERLGIKSEDDIFELYNCFIRKLSDTFSELIKLIDEVD